MTSYLLNRPVNALKKLYAPAYLGAKIRASKATSIFSRIQELAIKKRLHSSDKWSYKRFQVFKGLDDNQQPEYREYTAPSPSTATAEAYILNNLCEDLSSSRIENVYSYKRTPKGSSFNYEYYLPLYQSRNQGILDALSDQQGGEALFLDLKNYYASVNKDLLANAIKRHSVLSIRKNQYAIDFLLDQISQSPSGIPIGTELSHFLGDVYLEPLDNRLKEMLNKNYFRYVDDITIVGDKRKLDQIELEVKNIIESLGLKLNDTKREVFSLSRWRDEMDTSPVDGDDFYKYCQNLGDWIGNDIAKEKWLQSELINLGFQIPLRKIISRKHSRQKRVEVEKSKKNVINTSIQIREKYLVALEKVAENLSKDSSRWYLQKTKRTLNPLFYLLNTQNYQTITDTAKESSKLKTQEEVSYALCSNTYDRIIKYPGVTMSTFCEIWQTVQPRAFQLSKMNIDKPTAPEIESLTTLALYKILPPQDEIISTPIWQALRAEVESRSDNLDGFEAEIESLRIGVTEDKQRSLLDDRLNDEEDIFLSGLELGNQSISP